MCMRETASPYVSVGSACAAGYKTSAAPRGGDRGTTPFTDLTANWYKPAILWAYQNNVVAGKSPTTFDPEGPVTREQIAVILTQYMFHVLKMKRTWTPADLSTFPDGAQVSGWAKEAMQDAVALGLINGTKAPDGLVYLDPQGSAARQQVATILMNFCQNVKNNHLSCCCTP